MKLVLKTVSGKQHETDVTANTTVLELKQTLAAEYDVASLRLVYKGNILDNAKTMAELGIAENDSVVIAGKKRGVAKPPASAPDTTTTTTTTTTTPPAATTATTPPSSPAQTTSATTTTPTTTNAHAPSATTTTTTPAAAPPSPTATPTTTTTATTATAAAATTATTATAATPPAAPPASSTAGVDASLIDSIVAMGFDDRARVALALRAAYMNADRAVEYLCSGIPPARMQEMTQAAALAAAPPPPPSSSSSSSGAATSASHSGGSGGHDDSSSLRTALQALPQFAQVREVFQQNNASMPVILQQIAQRYPHVYALIQAQPEQFMAIMNETPGSRGGGGSGSGSSSAAATAESQATDESMLADAVVPSQVLSHLSDAELADVQELVTLGGGMWDAQAAALVYVVAQRNKEFAASLLFEHGGVPPGLLEALARGGVTGEALDEHAASDDDGEDGDDDDHDERHA